MLKKVLLTLAASICLLTASYHPVSAAELKYPVDSDKRFNWSLLESFKKKYNLSGEKLTIMGPWLGVDKELVESVIAYFEYATGADVEYTGSDSFENQIVIDIQGGTPPNIAVFPQPGLAADVASKGGLTPLGKNTRDWVLKNYSAGQSWVDLGTYKDAKGNPNFYGFFYKVDVKSLVWYVPSNFEEAGYSVPETMEDLYKLSDQIVKDGGTPWCIGIGSGDATGWPATDWVEDMMLRLHKPDVYDKWVNNTIKFSDPRVLEAIDEYGKFSRNDAYVDGGSKAVAASDFRDNPKGLFSVPPRCYLHRQASFIPSFFPKGTVLGRDADFFYFPPFASKNLGKPVLGAGTLFAITKDNKAAKAFIDFLKLPFSHEIWMAQSGFLTPHKGVNPDAYANNALKKQGEILLNATTFRFDASDLMPGAIGAGAFWKGMVDYSSGKSSKEVADNIQKNWDTIK